MLVSKREIQIEWGDCDPAGIVFYPRYFAWFDACTAHLFELATGLRKIELLKAYDIVGFPMADTRARFLIPSKFGDMAVVETRITEFRTSSFNIEHRLLKEGVLAVEGFETRVWVGRHPSDPARLKSRPVPQELIAKFLLNQ
jgi:4-hydroxybenzoyl-CoA thioesterase